MKSVARKLVFYVVALWAAISLNFFLPRLMPGSPVDMVLAKMGTRGQVLPEQRRAIEIMLGTSEDEPLWRQYIEYWAQLARGDFGLSVSKWPTPVSDIIAQTLPWTIGLVGLATVIAFTLGITLGTFAGWKRGSWLDSVIPFTTLLQSIPYFWLALILLFVFAVVLRIAPIAGGFSATGFQYGPQWSWAFIGSVVSHGILPAATIVLSSLGGWMLGMRNMMVSTLSEDYITTAKAKGLSPRRIRWVYAARNAVLPSISGFAISLGFVVAGSIVTEMVFSYPGIGYALYDAVTNNDYPLMQGIFLVITCAVLGANLIVDLLYSLIDPRTRARS
ncbi:MAG: ABC transporter permease [Propionibacteriaceae bacterium]|jgi:peptide/nickel transport system permease protein|nr:ABC transporter permease [Propionibacteriaceae bacterium]